jgi:RNA polymerase sigma factor (sigma-70 family)
VEKADEALQDTWLRLETANPSGPVENPQAYLLRMAYNLSVRNSERNKETVSLEEARVALDVAAETPEAERVVAAKEELALLQQAIMQLPERQRAILLARRLEDVSVAELALRHSISPRMVQYELNIALKSCAEKLGKNVVRRFSPRAHLVSKDEGGE